MNTLRTISRLGDEWHLSQAEILRKYVKELKIWIHKEEGRK